MITYYLHLLYSISDIIQDKQEKKFNHVRARNTSPESKTMKFQWFFNSHKKIFLYKKLHCEDFKIKYKTCVLFSN